MTDADIILIFIGILGLLISFGSLFLAFLTFLGYMWFAYFLGMSVSCFSDLSLYA